MYPEKNCNVVEIQPAAGKRITRAFLTPYKSDGINLPPLVCFGVNVNYTLL